MLHVLNGDATRVQLEQSGIAGVLTVWADVLHDGPVPIGVSPQEFRRVRARYLSTRLEMPESRVRATSTAWDKGLEGFHEHEEVVFWFEHDLFDQLILIRHLHWLTVIDRGTTRFSLICHGSFPGVADFTGLATLTPSQLAGLLPERAPLTTEQIRTGAAAWEKFCAPEPHALSQLSASDTAALPFLHGALRRHFEDYPSTRNGLSRSEQQLLAAIESGHETFGEVFAAAAGMEERVFMGDSTCWAILKGLALAREPLVEIAGARQTSGARVTLTAAGRRVLECRANHVRLNGIARWAGGVELTAGRHYRWDGHRVGAAEALDFEPPAPTRS